MARAFLREGVHGRLRHIAGVDRLHERLLVVLGFAANWQLTCR
jgi:hypothetical protein